MLVKTAQELESLASEAIEAVSATDVKIKNESALRGNVIDAIALNAAIGANDEVKSHARWLIRASARALGIHLASIQGLYAAMGRGDVRGVTTPAINVRGLAYDTCRAVFRAARKIDASAFLFEIARSEISYTDQRPVEYSAIVLAAAIREGWKGAVFVQGDHFQINAKKYKENAEAETANVRKLIEEGVGAGFYNIDVDTSTLVDLSHATLKEQQRLNYELAADYTALIRKIEPKGITVSVGAEIGEVGGKNSTVEEFLAFMEGYVEALAKKAPGAAGISKISIQTGTSHGGVPLPDGTIAKVAIDFDALVDIGKIAQSRFGLSGSVQHGASTLPDEVFDRFPQSNTSEIHLATGFQNILFDHEALPAAMKEKMYAWLRTSCADEMKAGQTDEQFFYKTRKKALGQFKREFHELPAATRAAIGATLEAKFDLLFKKLGVAGSRAAVERFVKLVDVPVAQGGAMAGARGPSGKDEADSGE
ncbi:MAG: class II fructose-bisphosphate aldolase [bacterium]